MAYRIYLVDDDRFLLDLYAAKFKNTGHEVKEFRGGEELLQELRKEGADEPDAILMDLIMLGMTGFEVLSTIRKEKLASKAKIIILTNQDQDANREEGKKLGADGYIIKASVIPSEVYEETIRIIEGGDSNHS